LVGVAVGAATVPFVAWELALLIAWNTIALVLVLFALARCLVAGGCTYSGGQSSSFEGPGTPIGITSLSGPFEKLATPAPLPAGFSSTYQKILVDHQRLARRQDERDAKRDAKRGAPAKAAETNPKDGAIPK